MESKNFQEWAEDMIKYLADDIRETKKLTKETRALAVETKKQTDELRQQTRELRELVTVAVLQSQRPWWKKLFGIS